MTSGTEYALFTDTSVLLLVSRWLFSRVGTAPVFQRDVQHNANDDERRQKGRPGQNDPVVSQVLHVRFWHDFCAPGECWFRRGPTGARRITILQLFQPPQLHLVGFGAPNMP